MLTDKALGSHFAVPKRSRDLLEHLFREPFGDGVVMAGERHWAEPNPSRPGLRRSIECFWKLTPVDMHPRDGTKWSGHQRPPSGPEWPGGTILGDLPSGDPCRGHGDFQKQSIRNRGGSQK